MYTISVQPPSKTLLASQKRHSMKRAQEPFGLCICAFNSSVSLSSAARPIMTSMTDATPCHGHHSLWALWAKRNLNGSIWFVFRLSLSHRTVIGKWLESWDGGEIAAQRGLRNAVWDWSTPVYCPQSKTGGNVFTCTLYVHFCTVHCTRRTLLCGQQLCLQAVKDLIF